MTQGSSAVQRVDLGAESALVDAARALLDRAHEADGVEAFSDCLLYTSDAADE